MTDTTDRSATPPARQTTAYLKDLFKQVGFTIDARRGQNFLVDLNLLDLLERSAGVTPADAVLEVGSGTGALTERLARAAGRVVTVEIDPRLAQLARERVIECDNVHLVEGDVLAGKHRLAPEVLTAIEKARAACPQGRLLLVANLPYCVATPVISNLLALPRPFDSATVTVQREMAERMTAAAGSHSYNALSVWIGSQCRSEIVRILPPSVFWPRPKVDSAIVRLDLEPDRRARIADLERFHGFVRDIFCHRRKVMRGVLIRMAGGKQQPAAVEAVEAVYAAFGLGATTRAEEIPPDQFVELEREFFQRVD
ncbi:MAG: 16S rRNA (adenine(1518)-N(6)/adenine(1519)-N(6))-dimethyltransferase RsmA [Planctomycetota bacterium]|jgi:16S rRNA (adenine1518-N6/adenine1519-N6)-dimethyltransferase|nr:16S rRNA (adenine(1518)-N(6)/adenine(1519)-N(6))-dimethyltransferase RsmA [Planctomycetota bacterium]